MSLPEPVPPRLAAILEALSNEDRAFVEEALTAKDTFGDYVHSGEWVAFSLREAGYHIGETTVKQYRRLVLNRQEVQV